MNEHCHYCIEIGANANVHLTALQRISTRFPELFPKHPETGEVFIESIYNLRLVCDPSDFRERRQQIKEEYEAAYRFASDQNLPFLMCASEEEDPWVKLCTLPRDETCSDDDEDGGDDVVTYGCPYDI